jgi:hypothetical protein
MPSFPALSDLTATTQAQWGAYSTGYLCGAQTGVVSASSGTTVTVSPGAAFAPAPDSPTRLVGFGEEVPRALTTPGEGTSWLAGRVSPACALAGWTGVPGTHYAWLTHLARPAVPPGGVLLAQVTVSGGAVTTVVDYACRRLTGQEVLSAPRTVHSSALWVVEPGARLQVGSGVTFLFGGQLVAGRYAIFDQSSGGTFSFARGAVVFPEWWGAVTDDPTVDSAPALQSALSLRDDMVVDCAQGVYTLASQVTVPHLQGWILQGQGKMVTTFRRAPGYVGPLLSIGSIMPLITTGDVQIKDLGFDGIDKAVGVIGIEATQMTRSKYSRLHFTQCDVGLKEHFTVTQLYELLTFQENRIGYLLINQDQGATMHTWIGGRFSANLLCGHSIDGTAGTGLIRRLTFYGTVFEANDALVPAGDNVGLSIKRAFAIQCINCWFEGNATHVYLNNAGAEASNPMRYIEFRHCQFSPRNINAVSPNSFLWEEGISGDGQGSLLENCFMRDGVYQFNQNIVVPVIGSTLNPVASLAGNFVKDDFLNRTRTRTRDPAATGPWVPELVRREFGPYNVDFTQRYVSITTTSDVNLAIDLFDLEVFLPNDGTLAIWVYMVGTQADATQYATYSYVGIFQMLGGVVADPFFEAELHPPIETAGATAWNAGFILDAGVVKVVVKGAPAPTEVYWAGYLRATRTLFTPTAPLEAPWETVGEWRLHDV